MTMQESDRSAQDLEDWEAPGRLLTRYLQTGGMQAVGALLSVLGFIVLFYGWWKISKESVVALQIPYLISGGIGGVLFLTMGGILLVTHELRLDNRRLQTVEESVAQLRDILVADLYRDDHLYTDVEWAGAHEAAENADQTIIGSMGFVRVPGGSSVHNPDCSVVAGKNVQPVTEDDLAELSACKLCAPVF